MIVVTGATGHLGRHVVEELLCIYPPSEIGVSVQDVGKAADLSRRGLRVRKGDFGDPTTLAAAFDGAEQVLIVSMNKFGAEAVAQHGNAINAAKQAGVKRILYTSHQAASASSAFVPARDHAATEALLAASGVPFVALRNGFYAESALFRLTEIAKTGRVTLPPDGPVSWTARNDLARAAARALAEPALVDGISPPLTARACLDFSETAAIASGLLGRPCIRETISDETYKVALIAQGVPEFMADALGSHYKASRAGEFAIVDQALARWIGREPMQIHDVLRDFLHDAMPKPPTDGMPG